MNKEESKRASELASKMFSMLVESDTTSMEKVQALSTALTAAIAAYDTEEQRRILAEVVTDAIKNNVEASHRILKERENGTKNDGSSTGDPMAKA